MDLETISSNMSIEKNPQKIQNFWTLVESEKIKLVNLFELII